MKPPEYASAAVSDATDVGSVLPEDPSASYNMHDFIDGIVDAGSFFPIKHLFAQEVITGFARLNGKTVGKLILGP